MLGVSVLRVPRSRLLYRGADRKALFLLLPYLETTVSGCSKLPNRKDNQGKLSPAEELLPCNRKVTFWEGDRLWVATKLDRQVKLANKKWETGKQDILGQTGKQKRKEQTRQMPRPEHALIFKGSPMESTSHGAKAGPKQWMGVLESKSSWLRTTDKDLSQK